MSANPFVHLHLHSYYSLLDGLSPVEAYVKKAKEQGATAIAITDHGVMHGNIEFYKACKKHGIKPILGCEIYIAFNGLKDKRPQIDNKRTHCILLAETQEGYENLLKMVTIAHLEGYYYKPRVDWELLKENHKGLIVLSGCLQGDMAEAILNHDEGRVNEVIEKFQSTFGKDNFFLELQDHPTIPQQKILNDRLIEIHKAKGIPVVATADCHYVNAEDNLAQDIMICIQSGKNLDDTGRLSMMNADYSMRPPEEIIETFKDIPEAIENTVKIAERCNVSFSFDKPLIPVFPTPDGREPAEYLRDLCYQGLIEKYKFDPSKFSYTDGVFKTEAADLQAMVDRMEFELGVITKMGFVGYFLIVWDFVKWSKDHGIVVGPGRGSAAGAIVSYALDITEIDPLKYHLLFERFLNPERISMPDIDLDFADNRRDEVLEYVAQKYGRDRVAQICTFGTLAARAAVKDVGRVMGVPFTEMNEFVKFIPEKPGTKLQEALDTTAELREAVAKSEVLQQVMKSALKLEGAVRHVSVHACAVVIAPEPLIKYTALQHAPKDDNVIITQYSAKPLEALGLLKMDFLGLKNLTILQTALKIIDRTKNKKIVLKDIPMDDRKTYALLSRGETTGVFQLESAGMKRYLKELKPTEFEDIIAMVSLYRPGPMEWIPDYIAGKNGKKKPVYAHVSLEPILKTTFGIAIYQEQILQIAQVFAGFSLGEADLLRRAIGKKIASELADQRQKFIDGAVAKGHKQELAVTIFDKVVEPFAGYGFNKSHGACYAMIAYQTAYLKAHYPTEFMTALLSSDADNTDRIVIEIGESEQMGIQVLPPEVNESRNNFTVVKDGTIRFGLSAIKGLGEGSVKMIIEARDEGGNFKNIEDFAMRVPAKILNKKTLEALAFSGAMESLGERNEIGLNYQAISDFGKNAESTHQVGQAGLFDDLGDMGGAAQNLKLAKVDPATPSQNLKWEKEFLGLYVSDHPLAGLKKYFQQKTIPLSDLASKTVSKGIKVGGIITALRKITTKKGDMMAILTIEDPFGKGEAVVFPKAYQKVGSSLTEDQLVILEGVLEKRGSDMQVVVNDATVMALEDMQTAAKKEGLWTAGEKIERVSRHEQDEHEMVLAEAVMVANDDETALALEAARANGDIYRIILDHNARKEDFMAIRDVLLKYPGPQRVELVIGERVLPLPMTVKKSPELVTEIDAMLKA